MYPDSIYFGLKVLGTLGPKHILLGYMGPLNPKPLKEPLKEPLGTWTLRVPEPCRNSGSCSLDVSRVTGLRVMILQLGV